MNLYNEAIQMSEGAYVIAKEFAGKCPEEQIDDVNKLMEQFSGFIKYWIDD